MKTFNEWHKENAKYMEPADIVAWCAEAWMAGFDAAKETKEEQMLTKTEIDAIALDYALNIVFSNVGEEDWPEDAMAWLRDDEDADASKEMVPWEPFEDFNEDRIYDTVLDFQHTIVQAINEALAIERG